MVTVRGVADCRNLTDGRTNGRTNEWTDGRTDERTDGRTNERMDGRTEGRTDIHCLSNGRKNRITLKDQTTKMYQSSREICLRKSGVRYA